MTEPSSVVPATVLDAFGLAGVGRPLSGGQGRSVRFGEVVLKPVDDPVEAAGCAEVLASVAGDGFRIPQPRRARDGRWVVDGWSAAAHVAGRAAPAGHWDDLLAAARSFHAALAPVARPAFLDRREHRWARADRAAWEESALAVPAEVAGLWDRLTRLRRPVDRAAQLIHGDLSGNVLFAADAPPAIIDFSPYWRPVAYATAIVAVDAALWFGEDRLLSGAGTGREFAQLLVRAALFRLGALTEKGRETGHLAPAEVAPFPPVVDAVERLARA